MDNLELMKAVENKLNSHLIIKKRFLDLIGIKSTSNYYSMVNGERNVPEAHKEKFIEFLETDYVEFLNKYKEVK